MINFEATLAAAWRRTRHQLFQPFSLRKWLVLGFSAFLASLIGGGWGGGGFYGGDYREKIAQPAQYPAWLRELLALDPLLIVGVAIGFAVFVCAILIALLWIGARGQFIFLDNVRHNRAEIVRPWRDHQKPGNAFFALYLWIVSLPAIGVLLLVLAALIVFLPAITEQRTPAFAEFLPWILVGAALLLVCLIWAVLMTFYREFGVPIMVVTGCGAADAFWRVWALLREHPVDCLVYALIRLAMEIVFGILTLAAGCLTCCVGFLPYVSSVLTLPFPLFRQSFTLDCLTQLVPDMAFWPAAELE